MAVARRTIDRHAGRLELGADRVDVVDRIGEMSEITPGGIGLRIPVVSEFDRRLPARLRLLYIIGRGEEDERVARLLVVDAACLGETHELKKRDRRFEIRHADHRVQIFHGLLAGVCFANSFGA